jgi:hypothetical protein
MGLPLDIDRFSMSPSFQCSNACKISRLLGGLLFVFGFATLYFVDLRTVCCHIQFATTTAPSQVQEVWHETLAMSLSRSKYTSSFNDEHIQCHFTTLLGSRRKVQRENLAVSSLAVVSTTQQKCCFVEDLFAG